MANRKPILSCRMTPVIVIAVLAAMVDLVMGHSSSEPPDRMPPIDAANLVSLVTRCGDSQPREDSLELVEDHDDAALPLLGNPRRSREDFLERQGLSLHLACFESNLRMSLVVDREDGEKALEEGAGKLEHALGRGLERFGQRLGGHGDEGFLTVRRPEVDVDRHVPGFRESLHRQPDERGLAQAAF